MKPLHRLALCLVGDAVALALFFWWSGSLSLVKLVLFACLLGVITIFLVFWKSKVAGEKQLGPAFGVDAARGLKRK